MTAMYAFTIRPLERKTPDNALEGAFRVHISDKDLKALNLSRGDLVRLNLSDGPRGFGIAWNATQTNPGNKPIAKVTDLLKDKYGLTLQDRPFIEKSNESWKAIDSVEVSFNGDAESLSKFGTSEELLYWARYALGKMTQSISGFV
jgi:AAA family ATPase